MCRKYKNLGLSYLPATMLDIKFVWVSYTTLPPTENFSDPKFALHSSVGVVLRPFTVVVRAATSCRYTSSAFPSWLASGTVVDNENFKPGTRSSYVVSAVIFIKRT